MRPQRVRTPMMAQPGRSYIQPEPKGVVLIIAPWNYPLSMVARAAGRRDRRRQLRGDEAVRGHHAHVRGDRRDPAALPRQGRVRGRRGRHPRDHGAARAALRPHPLHRQRARGQGGDDRGRQAPHAGHARAGRQEPVPDRQERRPRGGRLAHRLGQVHQRRADLRRARPRAGAPRGGAALRRHPGAQDPRVLRRRPGAEPGLLPHRERAPYRALPAAARRATRSTPAAASTWPSATSSRPSCSIRRPTPR